MKKVLALAVHNFEDVELLGFVDVIKRHDIDFDIAYGVEEDFVKSQTGHKIKVELRISDVINNLDEYDGVFLPGGSGYVELEKVEGMKKILDHFVENDKVIGAICAAPTILATHGIVKDKNIILYPGKELIDSAVSNGAIISEYKAERGTGQDWEVVIDGNIITGMGMRTTFIMADKYAELLNKK